MVVSRKRLLGGGLCGALGSLAMKGVLGWGGPNAFGLSSQTDAKAARALFGEGLEQRRAEQIGSAMHYVFGIATGVGYALASQRLPAIRSGRGTSFGAGLWLIGDELAATASRLESPGAASGPSHLWALAAHLLYGFIVDGCVSRADRLVAAAVQNPQQDV